MKTVKNTMTCVVIKVNKIRNSLFWIDYNSTSKELYHIIREGDRKRKSEQKRRSGRERESVRATKRERERMGMRERERMGMREREKMRCREAERKTGASRETEREKETQLFYLSTHTVHM